MSETLFDYQTRLRDEEVLYLARAIAEKLGIAPFPGVAEPAAQTPPLRVVEVEALEPAEETTRRRRFNFSKFDDVIRLAEESRTGWRARGKAAKTAEHRAYCETQEIYWKNLAARRRKRIEFEIKKGRAEIVDGVLYDLRSGVRAPWDASLFVTK